MTDQVSEQPETVDHNKDEQEISSADRNYSLQFPQILLQASFESLLTHSIPSGNNSTIIDMDQPSKTSSSLGESWASLEDAEYVNEDDLISETTDPGSLLDAHSVGDVQSRGEDDTASELEQTDESDNSDVEENEHILQQASVPTTKSPPLLRSSTITSSIVQDRQITLQEPEQDPKLPSISIDHVLKIFSPTEVARLKLRPSHHNDTCVGTIRMQLSSSPLDLDGRQSYRIMLLGKEYVPSVQKAILEKIGDALMAGAVLSASTTSNSPTRYHIVPDSFGPGSKPVAAEIIPIEWQLEVQQYHRAVRDDQFDDITLFDDHNPSHIGITSERDGPNTYKVTDEKWTSPDLAILCVSRNDLQEERYSTYNMQKFVARHKVPLIILRMDQDWNARFDHTLIQDDNAAHMRVVASSSSNPRTLQLLPVDLSTFLNLNSNQLNRHLAFLSKTLLMECSEDPAAPRQPMQEKSATEKHTSVVVASKSDGYQGNYLQYLHVALQVIAVMMIAGIVSFGLTWCKNSITSVLTPSTDLTATTTTPELMVATSIIKPSLSSTTANAAISALPLSDSIYQEPIHKSNGFQIEMLGRSNLLVRVPIHHGTAAIKDNLDVQIYRNQQPIPVIVETLFDHVYNLQIDPHEAYGEIEVHMKLLKPSRMEKISINLGSKSFIVHWQESLALVQKYADQVTIALTRSAKDISSSNLTTSVVQQLQKLVPKVTQESKHIVNQLQQIDQKILLNKADNYRRSLETYVATQSSVMRGVILQNLQESNTRGKVLFNDLAEATKLRLLTLSRDLDVRSRIKHISTNVQDRIRSEKLATAQDRAFQIIRDISLKLKHNFRQH